MGNRSAVENFAKEGVDATLVCAIRMAERPQPLVPLLRVKHVARGFPAIPPRSPDLLDILLHAPWHLRVNDCVHVVLVQAHPKRHRRSHDSNLTLAEEILDAVPFRACHLGVVGLGENSVGVEVRSHQLCFQLEIAVDDDRLLCLQAAPWLEQSQHSVIEGVSNQLRGAQPQVGAERGHLLYNAAVVQFEHLANRGDGFRGSSRRESQNRLHLQVLVQDPPEAKIGRTECVPPLRDAVGFVNAHERRGLPDALEGLQESLGGKPLWRDEHDFDLVRTNSLERPQSLGARLAAAQDPFGYTLRKL
mmetsp:Transcript_2248/g.6133  ORF Transcript_2248/g.6133 Transcript_2248/m.6133 type:complete len:304 (-) Transcript_2248:451-1362(-)